MINKFNKMLMFFAAVAAIIILLILSFKSIVLFTLLTFGIIFYLSKKKLNKFCFWLFIVSFLIRIMCIIVLNYEQVYDFKILLDASKVLAGGDFSFNQWGHLRMWGYQTGFVMYQALLLKIFNSVTVLKVLNAIYSSCLVLIVYYFSKRLTNERIAKVASMVYMILPFPLFLNTVLTNQHLATLLMYLSIIFLLKDDGKTKNYVIAAILLALSNIIRPEAIIVVTTLIIYEIGKIRRPILKETLKKVFLFIIIYLSINSLASQIVIKTGINPVGLTNQYPLWKFVLGFNHETCGYYTEDDLYVQMDKEASLNLVKERVTESPVEMIQLFTCKIDKFWLQSSLIEEAQAFEDKKINIFGFEIYFNEIQNLVMTYNNQIYLSVLILSIMSILFLRKKEKVKEYMFFIIMLLVCFGVFLLIEIQPRYIYFIHIPIFILSSYGFDYFFRIRSKIMKVYNK